MKSFILYISTIIYRTLLIFQQQYKVYNSSFWRSVFKADLNNNIELSNLYCSKSSLIISGKSNQIVIEGELYNSHITIQGKNNSVKSLANAHVHNVDITIKGENCEVFIGSGTTFGSATIVCMGEGNMVHIGSDCMISDSVEIWATDSHPIYKLGENQLINQNRSIKIGNHVWLGKKSMVLKGSIINDGSIVGMGSLVTKEVPCNSLCVGNPMRIVKNQVKWERNYIKN